MNHKITDRNTSKKRKRNFPEEATIEMLGSHKSLRRWSMVHETYAQRKMSHDGFAFPISSQPSSRLHHREEKNHKDPAENFCQRQILVHDQCNEQVREQSSSSTSAARPFNIFLGKLHRQREQRLKGSKETRSSKPLNYMVCEENGAGIQERNSLLKSLHEESQWRASSPHLKPFVLRVPPTPPPPLRSYHPNAVNGKREKRPYNLPKSSFGISDEFKFFDKNDSPGPQRRRMFSEHKFASSQKRVQSKRIQESREFYLSPRLQSGNSMHRSPISCRKRGREGVEAMSVQSPDFHSSKRVRVQGF